MRRRGRQGDLRGLTEAYLGRIDPEGRRFAGRAAEAWKRVAGIEIGKHTAGSALRDGELLVYVDSPAWANELSVMTEHLRARLNEELGEELVRSVRFAVSRRVQEERAKKAAEEETEAFYTEDGADHVPLSEQERMQVEHVASTIQDKDLRDAAVRAMTRHLEWKKGTRARNGREAGSE
ncbi:MAG TPA: DUF721 domain-containing protein [Coriobacteriia bacterium]|jgi:hypothetical protein